MSDRRSPIAWQGSTIIAHERLAIVDPDSGDQPLFNEAPGIFGNDGS